MYQIYNSAFRPGDDVEEIMYTFLTAAGFETASISWSLSQTVGRQAGGSVFATYLLNSIITATDRTGGFYNGEKGYFEELNDKAFTL